METIKEMKVFLLSADNVDTNAYEIEEWINSEILPDSAIAFIEQAEEEGFVYSLIGFQNAINLEEISSENTWIFITNKY